jgi:hypothetical protein
MILADFHAFVVSKCSSHQSSFISGSGPNEVDPSTIASWPSLKGSTTSCPVWLAPIRSMTMPAAFRAGYPQLQRKVSGVSEAWTNSKVKVRESGRQDNLHGSTQ